MTLQGLKSTQFTFLKSGRVTDIATANTLLRIIHCFEDGMFSEEHSEHVRISLIAEELEKYDTNPMNQLAYNMCKIIYASAVDFKERLMSFRGSSKEDFIKHFKNKENIYNRMKSQDLNTQWELLELTRDNESK